MLVNVLLFLCVFFVFFFKDFDTVGRIEIGDKGRT